MNAKLISELFFISVLRFYARAHEIQPAIVVQYVTYNDLRRNCMLEILELLMKAKSCALNGETKSSKKEKTDDIGWIVIVRGCFVLNLEIPPLWSVQLDYIVHYIVQQQQRMILHQPHTNCAEVDWQHKYPR